MSETDITTLVKWAQRGTLAVSQKPNKSVLFTHGLGM